MRNLVFLLLFVPGLVFSQESTSPSTFTVDSDTTYYYEYVNEVISTFKLTGITEKTDEWAFRFWRPSGFLEVTKNGPVIAASFTFMVTESRKKERKLVKSIKLSAITATALYVHIHASEACQLPSSNSIQNWVNGYDGVTYIYETKNESELSFKWYWSPRAQEGVPEAQELVDFNKAIDEIIDFGQLIDEFNKSNPFQSFKYYGAFSMTLKIPGKNKVRKR